jgi:hypothetical protein
VPFSRYIVCSITYCQELIALHNVIQKFQDATLEFSQTKVPTISKVLPLFKMIQQHLEDALQDSDLIKDKSGQKYRGLKRGFQAGLDKINIHLKKALVGDYPLLGAGERHISYTPADGS